MNNEKGMDRRNFLKNSTIGKVIKDFDRKSLFITSKLSLRRDNNKEKILERAYKCLERLQTDYIDCMMLHILSFSIQ